jgi:hypothetical protein
MITDDQATDEVLALTMKIVEFLGDQPPMHPGIIHIALATALATGIKTCAEPDHFEDVTEQVFGVIRDIIGLKPATVN